MGASVPALHLQDLLRCGVPSLSFYILLRCLILPMASTSVRPSARAKVKLVLELQNAAA